MTISQSFVKFLEDKGYGVFGQNIFLFRVPSSLKTTDELFWIIPSGGTPIHNNKTSELIKQYNFLIYFRSVSAKRVDEVLSQMEGTLNCSKCVKLEGFDMVDISTTQLPADEDLDAENRMVGMVSVQIQTYATCV